MHEEEKTKKVLGLRIGATNTSAAVASTEGLALERITFEGEPVIPTVVAHDGNRWFVGREAKALVGRRKVDVLPMNMEAVDEFVRTNKHLPWITSAVDESKGAVNMTRMGFETLEAVENLQLQNLALYRKIQELEKEIAELKKWR